jgi:hypothetical protein
LPVLLITLLAVAGLIPEASADSAPVAQTERQIAGIVRHADTRVPLPGVTVSAGDRRTITDREGRFVLRVPVGVVST